MFRNPNQTSACGCGRFVEIRPVEQGAAVRGARLSVDKDWLLDLFEPFGPVSIRRMFSGAGVYRDGVFFALATSDGDIYLKCDSEIEQRFRDGGSRPFTYGRDTRKVTMSLLDLPGGGARRSRRPERLSGGLRLPGCVEIRRRKPGSRGGRRASRRNVRRFRPPMRSQNRGASSRPGASTLLAIQGPRALRAAGSRKQVLERSDGAQGTSVAGGQRSALIAILNPSAALVAGEQPGGGGAPRSSSPPQAFLGKGRPARRN